MQAPDSTNRHDLVAIVAALPGSVRGVIVICILLTMTVVNRSYLLESRNIRAGDSVVETAEVLYVPEKGVIQAIFLGYDQAAADLLWLRTLDYFGRHLMSDRKYDWLEHFVDQIIALDPQFRRVYHWAGANVLYGRRFTNTNVGLSNRFYAKALAQFPEDHEAAYRLGINYYIEMQSDNPDERRRFKDKGLQYLEMAANTPGAGRDLKRLVASLYSQLGEQRLAIRYLTEIYVDEADPVKREELRARLAQAKADIDFRAIEDEYAEFDKARKASFPYLSADMYIVLGQPTSTPNGDLDWRTLMPDLDLSGILAQ